MAKGTTIHTYRQMLPGSHELHVRNAGRAFRHVIRRMLKHEKGAIEAWRRAVSDPDLQELELAIKQKREAIRGGTADVFNQLETRAKDAEYALMRLIPHNICDARLYALEKTFKREPNSRMRSVLGSLLKLFQRLDYKERDRYAALRCRDVMDRLVDFVPEAQQEWVRRLLDAYAAASDAHHELGQFYTTDTNTGFVEYPGSPAEWEQSTRDAARALRTLEELSQSHMKDERMVCAADALTFHGSDDAAMERVAWVDKAWAMILENPPLPIFSGDTGADYEGETVMMYRDVVLEDGNNVCHGVDILILTSTGKLVLVACHPDPSGFLDKDVQKDLHAVAAALDGYYTHQYISEQITGTAVNRLGKKVSLPEELIANGWRTGADDDSTEVVFVTPRDEDIDGDVAAEVRAQRRSARPKMSEALARRCMRDAMCEVRGGIDLDDEEGVVWVGARRYVAPLPHELCLLSQPTQTDLLQEMKEKELRDQEWQVFPSWWMVTDDGRLCKMMVWRREPRPVWSQEHWAEEGKGWVSVEMFTNERLAECESCA